MKPTSTLRAGSLINALTCVCKVLMIAHQGMHCKSSWVLWSCLLAIGGNVMCRRPRFLHCVMFWLAT